MSEKAQPVVSVLTLNNMADDDCVEFWICES